MINAPDPGGTITPEAGLAWRDQLRAAGRAAGGHDIRVTASPARGQKCGNRECTAPATVMIVLLDRPGTGADACMQACLPHEPEMMFLYEGMSPPSPAGSVDQDMDSA